MPLEQREPLQHPSTQLPQHPQPPLAASGHHEQVRYFGGLEPPQGVDTMLPSAAPSLMGAGTARYSQSETSGTAFHPWTLTGPQGRPQQYNHRPHNFNLGQSQNFHSAWKPTGENVSKVTDMAPLSSVAQRKSPEGTGEGGVQPALATFPVSSAEPCVVSGPAKPTCYKDSLNLQHANGNLTASEFSMATQSFGNGIVEKVSVACTESTTRTGDAFSYSLRLPDKGNSGSSLTDSGPSFAHHCKPLPSGAGFSRPLKDRSSHALVQNWLTSGTVGSAGASFSLESELLALQVPVKPSCDKITPPSQRCNEDAANKPSYDARTRPPGCYGSQGGGVAMTTSQPSNASEWQLYNVLKRANLLQYYDIFIAQGGDDVQQLCEAGEDEFLEIMALVGMAAKPLHVRRLQKALQEWVANPAALEANASAGFPVVPVAGPAPGSINAVVRDNVNIQVHSTQTTPAVVSAHTWTPQPPPGSVSPSESVPSPSSCSVGIDGKEERGSSPLLQPLLMDNQIKAIAMAAASLAKQLPSFEPKDLNSKKLINREIQNLVSTTDTSNSRLEELRKYAAIYGRFDSKRKNDRPMSLHEISVNEAAAQLCLYCPALLTRREDLFPLARQVVRDSGYQYSKGHSRAADVVVSAKKARLDPAFQRHFDPTFKTVKQELDKEQREERMSAMAQELASIRQHQEQVRAELATATEEQDFVQTQKLQSELASLTSQQLQVLQEHGELLRQPRSHYHKSNHSRRSGTDDANRDCTAGMSGASSPVSDSNDSINHLSSATLDSLCAAIRNSNGTLFEEGLRIAQQYGMADFAQELKDLQSQRQATENSDDGNSRGSATKEFEKSYEFKAIKTELDAGVGVKSVDKDGVTSGRFSLDKGKAQRVTTAALTAPSGVNGVDVVEVSSSQPAIASPSRTRGDKAAELMRKGENIDPAPTRPPSRRSRASQSNSLSG